MKIPYYTVGSNYRYQSLPKSLEDKNYPTFERAVEAVKTNYKPFEYPHLSVELKSTNVWGMIPQQEISHFEKPRKKENPVYKTVKYPGIVKSYSKFNCIKADFSKVSYGNWANRELEGFYNLKLGAIKESIMANEGISWKAPILIQFVAAERVYTSEVKEVGKPYSPEKTEIIEKDPVSDWLPIYVIGDGRNAKYVIDPKECGTWEKCEQYFLTDYVDINHNELVIED